MIHLKKLTYAYRRKPALFDSLDLHLTPGQTYGLLGRNGVGKTSLLHILSGLLFPQSGEVTVMGFEPRRRQQAFLADLYFLAEDPYIPPVRIRGLLRMYAPFYPSFDEAYFEDMIHAFGLDINQHLSRLSFGERKKVMIAFGLATRCRLLLMDEPTNGLDIPSKKQFRELIAGAIEPDQIILLSTHQVRDLRGLIDSVIILEDGQIVLQESQEGIGERLSFQVQFRAPAVGECLYSEHTGSGYVCLKPMTEDADSLEIDLEVLFNAVILQPETFQNLFRKTVDFSSR